MPESSQLTTMKASQGVFAIPPIQPFCRLRNGIAWARGGLVITTVPADSHIVLRHFHDFAPTSNETLISASCRVQFELFIGRIGACRIRRKNTRCAHPPGGRIERSAPQPELPP